jgi:hypothetical protein
MKLQDVIMNEEVKMLRSELALLKLQFSERVGSVENRLNILLTQDETSTEYQEQTVTHIEEISPFFEHKNTDADISSKTSHITADEYLTSRKEWETPKATKPSFITILIQTILSSLFDWLSPVTKIYESYKAKGMLGIFILTIVGISLTLAGFGYLMQLLIDQLGAGSKSLLMCIAAISVIGLGIVLKAKTRFAEFATAIVSLGILLSYSTVYFSGSVYGLLPNFLVLILYLAIALICHAMAIWLETKVIAALGIIGVATMPMLSNAIGLEPLYYLLSLVFIVSSSLILAYRHVGQWLAHLCLAFTLVSLEWIIAVENIQLSVWIVNLFYLLFFVYVALTLFKSKSSTKQTLIFLAAIAGSTALVFFQAADIFTDGMSITFALNTFIAVALSVFFYKVKREFAHFFILLSASWTLLTIVSAISHSYWGIAWAVEGILLIVIGRQYNIRYSINQGQILTAIALLYSWSALAIYFPLPALKSVDGWMLSIMIVAILAIWQRLIHKSEVFDKFTLHNIKPLLQFLEVLWLSILCIVSAHIWLGNWTGSLVILMQLALLFRAKYCKQVSIEIFAASLILVPLFYAYQGALMVDSYRFTLLPLFAKLAIISAFLQLWLWSAFYRKYQPNSAIKEVAESLRIFFYLLIPICWVASVVRRFDEDSLMLLWLSPLLALLIARKVKHHVLFKETKILTGLASIFFAISIGKLTLINSIVAMVGFSSFYVIAYLLNRKNASALYQFICTCAVLSLGVAIPNIVGFQTNSLFYTLIIASLYWAIAFNAMNISEHLKRNEIFIIAVNFVLVIAAWLLIPSNEFYSVIPMIFLASAMVQKERKFKHSRLGEALKLNGDLFLHSIAAISYVILFASLTHYRIDLLISPALAVHGALILFLKDRRLITVKYSFGLISLGIIKLAMIDAANALLWQKVILFMGVGVFILLASFWYQKLVNRVDEELCS